MAIFFALRMSAFIYLTKSKWHIVAFSMFGSLLWIGYRAVRLPLRPHITPRYNVDTDPLCMKNSTW